MTTTQRAERPPIQDILRTAPFALARADEEREDGDGLTLDGYGAVFNRITIIDSWEGRFKEQLASGSMKKSFRELTPRIQFDHGRHPLIGSIPIARFEQGYPREDVDPVLAPDGGAHVVARLHDNWLVQPVREAIAAETIDGMSFRFGVVREEWHDADGKRITKEEDLQDLLRRTWYEDVEDDELIVRTLKEVRVSEIGPVVWPAYSDTSVGVRSQTVTIDLGRLSEPAERNKLAQAVILADRVDDSAPRGTSAPADAAKHPEPVNDTPRGTSPAGDAAEHLSAAKHHARAAALASVRHTLSTLKENRHV